MYSRLWNYVLNTQIMDFTAKTRGEKRVGTDSHANTFSLLSQVTYFFIFYLCI